MAESLKQWAISIFLLTVAVHVFFTVVTPYRNWILGGIAVIAVVVLTVRVIRALKASGYLR